MSSMLMQCYLYCKMIGSISFQIPFRDVLDFTDVLFVLELKKHLLLVPCMTHIECRVVFEVHHCTISDFSLACPRILARVALRKRLCVIHNIPQTSTEIQRQKHVYWLSVHLLYSKIMAYNSGKDQSKREGIIVTLRCEVTCDRVQSCNQIHTKLRDHIIFI